MRKCLGLLLALAVAGCSDAPAPAEGDDEGFLDARPDDVTGAISGVVVDESITPVSGALVAIINGPNATTDGQGRFTFEGLDPGTYFLEAAAPRHLPTQTSVQVTAGKTANVRLSLPTDGLPDPYKATHHFNGIIHVHATVAWALLEWILDSELGITTPACECAFEFVSDEKPQGHVYEAAWDEDTPPPSGDPSPYYWQYSIPDPFQEVFGYATAPIVRSWNEQPWQEETGTYKVLLLGPENWVAIEQSFEIFLTHWFNADVPEGWAITSGDS